jgi:hypothetical protein
MLTIPFSRSFAGLTPDEVRVATLTAKLEIKLAGYERILSNTRYLAGEVGLVFLYSGSFQFFSPRN